MARRAWLVTRNGLPDKGSASEDVTCPRIGLGSLFSFHMLQKCDASLKAFSAISE